ncbi:ferritin [Pontibacter diazotrophicus]|uniref:Ferritin n=1 Tax=Pontibacter diazotrophicus TaxID=1400979 RepID=A0A3D8LD54_9BACT|nr:ferritin [Pontibacter diazotrophicus]RDV15283.1 ferritin [Pontibacter diazotrophicus]
MKDLLRLRTSLTEEIEQILNEQIKMEAEASAMYLAMSSWCDRNGFDFSAGYFKKQSDEEREHMLRLFKYVSDMGGRAVSPSISNIPLEFESFKGVFEQALQQEIAVTQSFNRIADRCQKSKDYVTFTFLQWFLQEQIEEEYVARRALELFELIGEDGTGRYEIDKRVPKITYENTYEG